MFLSYSSMFTGIIVSAVLVLVLWIFMGNTRFFEYINIKWLFISCGLLAFRILVPLEFGFTQIVPITTLLPAVTDIFIAPIINLNGRELCVYHILLLLWITGCIYQLLQLYKYRKRFYTYINNLPCCKSPAAEALLHNIIASRKHAVDFEIKTSSMFSTPAIYGLVKPVIILPETDFSDEELFYILSHETTHYYHRDLFIKLVFDILHCICWWNPAMPLLNRQVSKLLELHADASVTSTLSDHARACYLQCMLKVARFQNSFSAHYALAFSTANTTVLEQRFQFVLSERTYSDKRKHLPLLISILIFTIALGASYAYNFVPHGILPEHEEGTFAPTAADSFLLETKNSYKLYVKGEYKGTIEDIDDTLEFLQVYKNLSEVPDELY